MPDASSHLALADHNQELLDRLIAEIERFPDWAATVAFYKALHLVEAVFARANPEQHGHDHQHRERLLKGNRKYSHIWKHYRPLQSISLVARYMQDAETDFTAYRSPGQVLDEVLCLHLHQIEQSAAKQLRPGDHFETIASRLPGRFGAS